MHSQFWYLKFLFKDHHSGWWRRAIARRRLPDVIKFLAHRRVVQATVYVLSLKMLILRCFKGQRNSRTMYWNRWATSSRSEMEIIPFLFFAVTRLVITSFSRYKRQTTGLERSGPCNQTTTMPYWQVSHSPKNSGSRGNSCLALTGSWRVVFMSFL